jgi:hypothetical protein
MLTRFFEGKKPIEDDAYEVSIESVRCVSRALIGVRNKRAGMLEALGARKL